MEFVKENIKLICAENLDIMKTYPDKYFDFAPIDPPFGINAANMQMGSGKNKKYSKGKTWDLTPPPPEFFIELFRISKKQMIFGGNYFDLPKVGGWVIWDKQLNKDISFSDAELAWTSFLTTIKTIRHQYSGFLGADITRIHITQKPIKLYDKIFNRFASPEFKVLDTHGGSFSSAISAYYFGFKEFVIIENDKEIFNEGLKRFKNETREPKIIFEPKQQIITENKLNF